MLFFNKWGILNLYLNVNKSQEKTKTVFVVWVPICFCAKRTSVAVHTSLKHTSKEHAVAHQYPSVLEIWKYVGVFQIPSIYSGLLCGGFWWKLLTLGIASFIHGIKCLIHIFFFYCSLLLDAISAANPRVIDDSRARKLSNDLKRCTYYETCSTYGLNVERVFQDGERGCFKSADRLNRKV